MSFEKKNMSIEENRIQIYRLRIQKNCITSSKPITPAPMIIIFSGTAFNESAPVDETICSSSIWIPGNGVTSDPVAIIMFLVRTDSFSYK